MPRPTHCADCGCPIEQNRRGVRRYCPDCATERQRQQLKAHWAAVRAEHATVGIPHLARGPSRESPIGAVVTPARVEPAFTLEDHDEYEADWYATVSWHWEPEDPPYVPPWPGEGV